ncbi:hypothetical protein Cantr_07221 [Candida viswanathii]|uniref:Uncharacterized protein n=1 Tax=Candida viswanathii TaxID=5486 RepID=A0A367XZF7_9ASCO|nr:hypothetical protein Cantr_07221 [Candida viswanathii]
MKQNTVPSQQIPEELAEQVQPLTEDDNYFESIRGEKPLNEEASGRAVSTLDDDMIFDATDALEPPDGETEFPNDGEGTRNNQLQEEQNGGQDVSSVRDGHTETATGPAEEPHEAPTRPIELDEIEFLEIESQDQLTQKVSRQSQRPNPPRLQIIGNVARLYNSSDESSDDDEVEEPPGSTIRETELNQANEGPSKPQDGGQSHNRPGDTTHNGGVVTEELPSNGHDEAGAMAEVDNTEAVDVPEMEAVDFAMEDVAENESHLRETIQKLREVVERAEAELAQREAAAKEIIEKGEGIRLAKERRIESLRQETEDLRQQLVEAERSIETEKEARESTEQRLRGLEQSYEQRLTELERTLATAESDAANEKREWESAQSEREKEVAQLTQQLASAKESLETEKEQRREIQEKLKEAVKWGERAMDLATDKVAEYVRELGLRRSAEGRIEELRKHIESLQASEVAIKEDVQKEKDERQHIEEELCKAQAENADLAKRLGATKYDLTVMTTSREAMRRESERLQWEVAGLTQELISTKSSIIKARAARQQAEKEATDLRGQNEALENKALELSGKLETVMEANKDAEEMVLSANNAHEAAEEKLRELSLQKTIAETEAQKEIDQLTSEVLEMREALRRETTTREAKEREAAALVHEVSGIKADLAIQRIRRVQADEKVDELTRREAQVRKAMEDEVTKRMQTEEENAQLALRILESESSAENERRAVEATERENEELKLQVASHQQLALELATRKEMEVRERQARELSEQKVEGLHEKLRATKEDVEIKIQQLTLNSQMLQKTIQKVREVEEEADRRTTEFLEKTALVTETADKERASRENAKEKCKQLTFELIDIKSTIQREKKARVYAEENNKSLTLRLIEEKSATQSERRAKERAEQLALEENLGNQAEKQRMTTELAQLQAALETERDERQKVAAERATIQAKLEEVTAICAQLRVHLSQEVTAAKKLVEDEKAARESLEISLQQTVAELRNQVANLFRKQIALLAAGMAVQKDFVESMAAELAQKEYKDPDDPMDVGEENSLSITREEDNELATGTRRESLATGSTSETECSAMIVEVLKEYDSMMREESAGERNFENYWVLNSPLPEEARQYEPQVQQLQQTAENRESESQRQFLVTLQVPMNRRIDTAQAFLSERNADRTGQVNGSQQSNHSWDGSLQDSDSEFARELDEKYQRLHGTSSSRHISKMMLTDNHPIEEDQSNNDEEPVYSESVDTGTTSSSSANSQGFDATSQASNGVVQSASIDPRELSYIEREAASRVNPNSLAIIYLHFSGKREANETAEEQRTAPQKDATIETVSEASTTIRKEVPHGRRNPATKDSAIRRYISSGKHRSAIEAHIRSASTRRDGTVRNIRNADNPTGIATALPTVVERIGGVEKVVVDLTIDSESEENDENDTTGNSRPLSPKVISRRGQKKQDGRVGKAGLILTTRNNRKKLRVEDENPMGNKAEREGERSGEYESTATPDKEESAPEETSAVTSKESSGTANESNNKSHEEVSLISRIKLIYLGKSDGNSDRESAQSAEIYPLATIDSIDKFSFRPWHRAAYFSKDSRSEIDESGTSESGTSESEASESGTSESEDEMDFAVRHRKSNRKTTNLRVKHDEIREQLVPCETSEPSTPQRLDNMLDEILAGSVKRKSNPKSKANRAKARKRGRQSRKGKSTKA